MTIQVHYSFSLGYIFFNRLYVKVVKNQNNKFKYIFDSNFESLFYLNMHLKYTLKLQTQLIQQYLGVFTKLFLISKSGVNTEWGVNCYCTISSISHVYSLCFEYSCFLNSLPITQDCEIKISHAAHSAVCLNL